jgi:hypothetical protein
MELKRGIKQDENIQTLPIRNLFPFLHSYLTLRTSLYAYLRALLMINYGLKISGEVSSSPAKPSLNNTSVPSVLVMNAKMLHSKSSGATS